MQGSYRFGRPANMRQCSVAIQWRALSRAIDTALVKRAGGAVLATLAGLGLAAAPGLVKADVFTVNTLADTNDGACDDNCSLREAITAANSNDNGPSSVDTVMFDSSVTGDIALSGTEIAITDELTIVGPGADALTLDANSDPADPTGESRIFIATSATGLTTISGLTLTNGFPSTSPLYGGAIFSYHDLNLDAMAIQNSQAQAGGGFAVSNGDAMVARCTIRSNVAQSGGGFAVFSGNVLLTDTTVSGNTATFGAGVLGGYGDVSVINSTISGNDAGSLGGGILVRYADVALSNSTVSYNSAGEGGGLLALTATDDITLANSIVADNLADTADAEFHGSGMLTVNHSLIEGSHTPALSGGVGNITGQDPNLGPLQDNGGPTLSHALLTGSPAIDTGDPAFASPPGPAFDQRGLPFVRVEGGQLDMGAVEVQPIDRLFSDGFD